MERVFHLVPIVNQSLISGGKLYAIASVETQNKMLLYTSEDDTAIQEDWNDKIIFYSPKITTGVDITSLVSTIRNNSCISRVKV